MDLYQGISRLNALVKTSRHYSQDPYEHERLDEMTLILKAMITYYGTNISPQELTLFLESDTGYITPKVDVRAVVFNRDNRLLLVKEKGEGAWALPGGWADVGYSPGEIAAKETLEEAGLTVTPRYLFKVVDKEKHAYPKSLVAVYKLFIYCTTTTYQTLPGMETTEARFFSRSEVETLVNISLHRNTLADLLDAFSFHCKPHQGAEFD